MASDKTNCVGGLCFDEIGYWSEIKLDIVKEYAQAYSKILATKRFTFAYIDGFAGSGVHLAKGSKELVPGSPLNALQIDPPFHEYFLVDITATRSTSSAGSPR